MEPIGRLSAVLKDQVTGSLSGTKGHWLILGHSHSLRPAYFTGLLLLGKYTANELKNVISSTLGDLEMDKGEGLSFHYSYGKEGNSDE